MKERPILFSGPMVLAILADLKDRTRRVIKPTKCPDSGVMMAPCEIAAQINGGDYRMNRYGGPGDRLWVRETFWGKHDTDFGDYGTVLYNAPALSLGEEFHPGIQHVASPECFNPPIIEGEQTVFPYDGETVPGDWWLAPHSEWNGTDDYKNRGRWEFMPWSPGFYSKHPSIHMPRWASRITLELLEVRAEKLQDITESDAASEGVICYHHGGVTLSDPPRYKDYLGSETSFKYCAKNSFVSLWSTIHDPAGKSGWDANPWVTVNVFRRTNGSN